MIYDLETGRIQENFNILNKFSVPSVQDYNMTDPSRSRSMSRSRSPSSRRRRGSGSRRDHSQGPGLGETAPDPGGTLRVQVRRRPLLLLPSYGSNTNNQLELGSMIAVSSIFMEDTGISSAGG